MIGRRRVFKYTQGRHCIFRGQAGKHIGNDGISANQITAHKSRRKNFPNAFVCKRPLPHGIQIKVLKIKVNGSSLPELLRVRDRKVRNLEHSFPLFLLSPFPFVRFFQNLLEKHFVVFGWEGIPEKKAQIKSNPKVTAQKEPINAILLTAQQGNRTKSTKQVTKAPGTKL